MPAYVKPGKELPYVERLKAAEKWPPHVSLEAFRRGDEHPATPFLYVPVSKWDTGLRPVTGTAWVSSPAVLLVNDQGQIEFGARLGVTYRILVVIGNSGAAPVLNGIAEFFLDYPPTKQILECQCYSQIPRESRERVGSGVSTFSVESRGWNWALSPPWTPRFGDWDISACVVVQIYDPLSDGPPARLSSWDNRKVAFRVLLENIAGTWSGQEMSEHGEEVGKVTVTHTPDWTMHDTPKGVVAPTWEINAAEFPQVPGRAIPAQFKVPGDFLDGGTACSFWPQGTHADNAWVVYFGMPRKGNTIYMRTQKGGSQWSHAVLSLTAPGAPPPLPDLALLKRIPRQMSPTWSARRRADAELVFHALAGLGI